MSDTLIQQVTTIIEAAKYDKHPEDFAHAAIQCVLAYFAEAGNVTDGMATAAHTCMGNTYDDIAAAMAAALKEMGDE